MRETWAQIVPGIIISLNCENINNKVHEIMPADSIFP
jgi:hypothetical protein